MSSDILGERILLLNNKLKGFLSYVESTPVDEILVNDIFWNKITRACNIIQNQVEQTKTLKYHDLVSIWIHCFATIIKKDTKLKDKVTHGPIKSLFQDIFNRDMEFPPWFLKTVFNFSFNFLQFDDYILSHLYNMVRKSNDYNTQKTFIEIITVNFDNNTIYEGIIRKNIVKKELQNLFTNILEDDNATTIRTFLNKVNNDENPTRIFSFKSDEIKLNDVLSVKDTWIDINIPVRTITFSCKRSDLFVETIPENLSNEDENDTITIKMSKINNLKYKSKSFESKGEITLEMSEAPTAFWDSTNEFLKIFRLIVISVTQNSERIKQFIFNYYSRKLEDLPDNFDRSNYEFIINQQLETGSPASTIIVSSEEETSPKQIFKKDSDNSKHYHNRSENEHESSFDERSVISASESEGGHNGYTSAILQTPKPHNSANISVDESQRSGNTSTHDDSICSASIPDISRNSQHRYDSSILATPRPRSANVSVAATYSSRETDIESQNTLSCTKNTARIGLSGVPSSIPETPFISVRTPEVINNQVIDLVSTQTNKDVSTDMEIDEQIPPTSQNLVENQQQSDLSEDDIPLAIRVANVQNEDDQHSHDSSEESNKTQNDLNTSKSSNASSTSSKGRKRRRQEDPNYLPGKSISNVTKIRPKNRKIDEEDEFEDTSFFSDNEKSRNEVTYTKTRVVRKPVFYGSDSEVIKKRNISVNQEALMMPPVKRLKTILPLRQPEETPPGSSTPKQIKNRRNTVAAISSKSEKKRRMSNINSVDHLQEQPQSQAFRLPLQNKTNQKSSEQVENQKGEKNDAFDKLKLNIPITQTTMSHQKIAFFSSSSDSSQRSPNTLANTVNPMDIIDYEDISPPQQQIINKDPPVVPEASKSPKAAGKVGVNKRKGKNPKKNQMVDTEPVFENNNIHPQKQTVKDVPSPSKSPKGKSSPKVYGGKVEVSPKRRQKKAKENAMSDSEAKQKRTAGTKSKGYETETPTSKPARKKNRKNNSNDLNENIPETFNPIQDSPKRAMPTVSNQIYSPCKYCGVSRSQIEQVLQEIAHRHSPVPPITSQVHHSPCQQCGVSRGQIVNDLQDIMNRLTELLSSLSCHYS